LRRGDDRVSWSFWLLLCPTICYGLASVVYGMQRNWAMAIVYLGYFIGNIGLLAVDIRLAQP
jgi:hypothetical protein